MSVNSLTNREAYAGDGVSTTFGFAFHVISLTDLIVKTIDAAFDIVTLVYGVDYTVSGGTPGPDGDYPGGVTVTTTVAPALGITLTVIRATPPLQPAVWVDGDSDPAAVKTLAFDRATLSVQRLYDLISRAPVLDDALNAVFDNMIDGPLTPGLSITVNPQGTGWQLAPVIPIISGMVASKLVVLTGTGVYTPSQGCLSLDVYALGGGGGGSGGGTTGGNGGTGGTTTFGSLVSCPGGAGGNYSTGAGGAGGATPTLTGITGFKVAGGAGGGTTGIIAASTAVAGSGAGASGPYGGAGGSISGEAGGAGNPGIDGTGSGASGGATTNVDNSVNGAGGGAGAYAIVTISPVAATYNYAVGAGGSAGTIGTSGGAGAVGGKGTIIVRENYQAGIYPVPLGTVSIPYVVTASITIPVSPLGVNQNFYISSGSSGPIIMSAIPQVSAGSYLGQLITFYGVDSANSVTFINGNGLILNGAHTMIDGSVLVLSWDGTNYREVSYNEI